jgi:uncharacterized membrane protein
MKRIKSFSPHKTALTLSIMMAVASLPFILFMAIMTSVMPMTDEHGNEMENQFPMGFALLVLPIIYFVMGYIFTAIVAWFYNLIAKYTGGIRLELAEDESS